MAIMLPLLAALMLNAAPAPAPSVAGNWPQFRGPLGDGTGTGTNLPVEWSEDNNIRWKTAIHDKGWSSPVVWGNQIWLTTAKEDGKEFFAVCVDRKSGTIIHDLSILKEPKPEFCHPFNSYASPTPVIEEGRVYIHFGSYGTWCLDTATGKVLWENRTLKCNHFRAPGSSPILHENLLILTFDGVDKQFLAALDKKTGDIVWKKDREIKFVNNDRDGDMHKGYSTPQIATVKGELQLISPAAQETHAYDPKTGKELWRVTTGGMNQGNRPIVAHDLVYLSCGHDQKLMAVKAGQTGTIPPEGVAWRSAKEAPTRPSCLVLGDKLFMVNDRAVATCLDAKTGKLIWRDRLDGDFSASPVSANGKIYFVNELGKTFVIEAADTFKPLATNKLAAGCMASPAIVGDSLILRTKTHLYCIGEK